MSGVAGEVTLTTATDALRDGAALQVRADSSVLQLGDSDRADFLHRLTTNEINRLRPGQSTVTVLTSPTARSLFVFTVVVRTDDLLLLPAAGQTEALARYLQGQIFFMDAVKVADVSEQWTRARLMGRGAGVALSSLGMDLEEAADGAWAENEGVLAVKQERYDVPGYELLLASDADPRARNRLSDAGVLLIDNDAYEVRRVELGRPRPGAELTDAYNPLESGLAWACAEDKGCYTGQEIIARQITYDKVTKMLVGLRSDGPMAPGAAVLADGRAVGEITSAAFSPDLGATLALAVIKRPTNEPGAEVTVDGQQAIVVALPFVQA